MKRTLLKHCLSITFLLIFSQFASSQINYTEDFEGDYEWESFEFYDTDEDVCAGSASYVANLYGDFYNYAEAVSEAIGTSNGGEVTVSYDYKIVDYYDTTEPISNADDWGFLQLYYATSPDGPFTLLETVNTTNHVASASCATRTVSFFPPAGTTVYLAFYAELGNPDLDYLLYLDDINVTQVPPVACAGTPDASTTVASATTLCQEATTTLSLSPAYTDSGLTFQWQTSTNGTDFVNVATGGAATTYATDQTATTWYRAVITCTASGQSVNSTPVQIMSTGLECLCDVQFDEAVEPITLVNFAGINNASSAAVNGSPGVENFTGITPGEVTQGEEYEITLEGNTNGDYDNNFTVFIDWNQNGDLTDDGEIYEVGFITDSDGEDGIAATGTIAVPEDALPGVTFMRVVKLFSSYTDDPCSSDEGIGYGQVEDYLINVSCNIEAPTFDEAQLSYCNTALGSDLPTDGGIVWYASADGDDMVMDETVLTNGTYYAAQVDGLCESEDRTAVVVTLDSISVDEMEDVYSCDAYTLPELAAGSYYTGLMGAGTNYEPGDEITQTVQLYIYAESETVEGCYAQTFFTVNIDALADIEGENTQNITQEGATVEDIVLETAEGATVTWYASMEDAENGEDALSNDTVLQDGTIYYAVQSVGDCSSDVFPVTVTTTLSNNDFSQSTFSVYPNPVKDVLNVIYASQINNVKVYNLLGQQVLYTAPNAASAQVDMSQLAAGTYVVKITAGTATKTIKVVKQ